MTATPVLLRNWAAPRRLEPANDAEAPAGIRVATVDRIGPAVWDAFVRGEPSATFFHLSGWQRVVARTYGYDTHYLAAVSDGRIVGVLPLVHLRTRLFGNALISNAFSIGGGIAASDPDAVFALAAAAAALGERLGVDYVELRSETAAVPGWLVKGDTYATFRRRLHPTAEANLKAIPRKKRADVRKGMASGLRVDLSGDIDAFYGFYAERVHKLGSPVFAKRFVRALAEEFGTDCEIAVVHGPAGPVAALASFFFRDRVLPYYGGGTAAARPVHAYDHLYWTLMQRAVARGATEFDFGRSKFGTGAFAYKTFWGFEPTPLRYQYHLVRAGAVPDINPLNPKFRLATDLWQRLPLAVANLAGPWIARQLG
jgi:FemAB-related protein (PEP-CTERM system-associated)